MRSANVVKSFLPFLALATLVSCGGGSPNQTAVTTVTGSVSPPSSPAAAPSIATNGAPAPTDMLLPPNALPITFPAIAQTLNYTFDPNEPVLLKVSAVDFFYPLDLGSSFLPFIDPTPFPGDPTLGQPNGMNIATLLGIGISGLATTDTIGNLPAFVIDSTVMGGVGSEFAGYVQPYSATANPNGFVYQTFGSWIAIPGNLPIIEGYFSSGIPTDVATLPVSGSAIYTGNVSASSVDAATREPFDVIATGTVTVDYSTRTVIFTTSGTKVLSSNANSGTPYMPRPGLDLNGVLTYVSGSNTFTGIVTSADGMNGNATGRLYGAVIPAATSSKSVGSPPEIGGTFALKLAGLGVLQGAFGAK